MPRTTLEELSNQCSSKMVDDGAEMKKTELDVLQRQRNKGPTDWQSVGRGIVPARDNLYISQQKSTHERERMVAETPEERKRLQRMSSNHTEERELRLECYSTKYMEHQSVQLELPLFNSIPSKPRCKNWRAQKQSGLTHDPPDCTPLKRKCSQNPFQELEKIQ